MSAALQSAMAWVEKLRATDPRELVLCEQRAITLAAEVTRLQGLINTPQTDEWLSAVTLEAAHQQERWGAEHDAGKAPADWFWLLGYLSGKALASFIKGDAAKGLHHIVSSGAALLNWHRSATGEMTAMRPGIESPDAALTQSNQAPGGAT